MNIRQTSLLISSILALSFISTISYELVGLYKSKVDNIDTSTSIETSSLLNKATIELSLERSVMQVTLSLDTPIQPQFRQLIDTQRKVSDEGFDEVNALLQASNEAGENDVFMRRLDTLRSEIEAIRRKADRSLSLAKADRSAKEIKQLPVSMKKVILDFSILPLHLNNDEVQLSSTLSTLDIVQKNAWAVREYGGRERTYLAIATATDTRFDDATKTEMAQNHARAEEAMSQLLLVMKRNVLSQEIKDAIQLVEDQYFGSYSRTREAIFAAAENKQPLPLSFDRFFVESSDALDRAVELSYLAGDEMEAYVENKIAASTVLFFVFVAVLALVVCICGFQIYYSQIKVSKRILSLVDFMTRLSKGDTSIDLVSLKSSDELGEMSECVEVFKQNAIEIKRLELAAEDLAKEFEDKVGGIVHRVELASQNMHSMAQSLNSLSNESSELSNSVASSSESAAADVNTVASAAEEMSASLTDISNSIADTAERSMGCSRLAKESQTYLSKLQDAIGEIDSVAQSINGISEQTNLLALNATIEAASAGDSGKGFAVVATEVKVLANQTRTLTDEISQKINDVKASAQNTIGGVNAIIDEISVVDTRTNEVASTIREQTDTTTEISRSASSAAALTEDVSKNISDVRKASSDSLDSTRELNDAASGLISESKELKDSVDAFIKQIRKS